MPLRESCLTGTGVSEPSKESAKVSPQSRANLPATVQKFFKLRWPGMGGGLLKFSVDAQGCHRYVQERVSIWLHMTLSMARTVTLWCNVTSTSLFVLFILILLLWFGLARHVLLGVELGGMLGGLVLVGWLHFVQGLSTCAPRGWWENQGWQQVMLCYVGTKSASWLRIPSPRGCGSLQAFSIS